MIGVRDYRWEKILRAISRETPCTIAAALTLLLEQRADLNESERKTVMDTATAMETLSPLADAIRT